MKMRKLGRTDMDVSEICLGTMTWGTQNTEVEGHQQMDYAVSMGVNFFDTADMYPATPPSGNAMGRTEEIIGTWFANRGKRDDIVLATKVAGSTGLHPEKGKPISAAKVRQACEESLQRLQTDYIDLYQLHWPNRGSYHFRQMWGYAPEAQDTKQALADMEDTLGELAKLVEEGKIRHVGLSNDTAWGVMTYLKLAEQNGWPRIASIQNEYSLLHRIFDTDWAELSHHEDVGLLAYSPLAAGLLTGKYRDGAIPDGSRRSLNANLGGRVSPYLEPALTCYLDLAKKHGLDPTQMALAFCLTRPFMASVIIGATSLEQLETCIGSIDLNLGPELLAEIDEIFRKHPIPL